MTTQPRSTGPFPVTMMTRDDVSRIFDVPVKLLPLSRCFLDTCRDVAHVVLYASADRLGGQATRPRQPVAFCLKHGGQVYDVVREWRKVGPKGHGAVCPTWLVADLKNNRLPRTSPDPAGWQPASSAALNKFKPGKR